MQSTPSPNKASLRQHPAPVLVVAGCTWAAVAGLVSMNTTGAVRLTAFLLAFWPPVVALLATMRTVAAQSHWKRMALGVLAFAVAATLEAAIRFQGWARPEEETVADLIYLAGYLLIASGIWSLLSRHGRSDIRAGLIDGAVMLLPTVVLLAEYVAHVPTSTSDGANWALRLLAAGYPLFDVVLLAALVWLAATPTLTRAHLGMLSVGMGLNLLVNMAIAVEVLSPNETLRRVVEGLVPLTWTVLAAGVATGAAVRYGKPRRDEVVHWGRIGVLGFGAILGPLTILVAALPPEPLPVILVSLAVVITSSWIVWRMLYLARFLGLTTNQLARARQELQVQATHDPLTGLLNRAVLDDVLEGLHRPGVRPAALLSIDLDLFKSVNDTYGHAAGDKVLETVADRLRKSVRPADLVLRMGGDEFLVAMESISAAEAARLAARMVTAVEQPIHFGHQDLRVAASVGIAMVEGDPTAESAAAVVARADAAMYKAKRMETGASGAVAQAAATEGPSGNSVSDAAELDASGSEATEPDTAVSDTAGPAATTVEPDEDNTQRPGTRELDPKR